MIPKGIQSLLCTEPEPSEPESRTPVWYLLCDSDKSQDTYSFPVDEIYVLFRVHCCWIIRLLKNRDKYQHRSGQNINVPIKRIIISYLNLRPFPTSSIHIHIVLLLTTVVCYVLVAFLSLKCTSIPTTYNQPYKSVSLVFTLWVAWTPLNWNSCSKILSLTGRNIFEVISSSSKCL